LLGFELFIWKETIHVDEVLHQHIEKELRSQLSTQQEFLKKQLWQEALTKANERITQETTKQTTTLQLKLKEQEVQLKAAELAKAEAMKMELAARKTTRDMELAKQELELKLRRELDAQLKQELQKSQSLEQQKRQLEQQKVLELEKQLSDTKQLLQAAEQKTQTVSQQLQGEVQELRIEQYLREAFPADQIEEVKKGQLGADVLWHVSNTQRQRIATVVIESKQTKVFSPKWLAKLREDVRAAKGTVGVLITQTLPDTEKPCEQLEGVWITNQAFFLPLMHVLRNTFLSVDREKTLAQGKDHKTHLLLSYLSGQEFRGLVESIVECFQEMQQDLDKEQRLLQLQWKKREKQLLRLATNTAYMYGGMQGILGSSLPDVRGLAAGGDDTLSGEPASAHSNDLPLLEESDHA
jgi:hypothetical protein